MKDKLIALDEIIVHWFKTRMIVGILLVIGLLVEFQYLGEVLSYYAHSINNLLSWLFAFANKFLGGDILLQLVAIVLAVALLAWQVVFLMCAINICFCAGTIGQVLKKRKS